MEYSAISTLKQSATNYTCYFTGRANSLVALTGTMAQKAIKFFIA
ncbi:MAG: hypothetical protein PUP93_01240 [Rhizonema sp. NSF051]|nr:hypothetical protein [Rhizonema sp. NSF051]